MQIRGELQAKANICFLLFSFSHADAVAYSHYLLFSVGKYSQPPTSGQQR